MQQNQPAPIILSVREITQAIKARLEPYFHKVCIKGEVSNLRRQSSGHTYFSLIEGDAQIACVLFRKDSSSEQLLQQGQSIIISGELSVYPPKGSYQIIVRSINAQGLGDALLKLQALKKKLHGLGWFAPERKKPLPKEIKTIGVVTSPTGAVIQDILNILTRRLGGFHLIINPVRVQGELAAFEIARAIKEMNTHSIADVLIVCRGGGSAEDLQAFNEEIVALACFESKIPVIAAIGHETDLSLVDLVADLRAPTPSAAAELVSFEKGEMRKKLAMLQQTTASSILHRLQSHKRNLQIFSKRLFQANPKKEIEKRALRLDELELALSQSFKRTFYTKKSNLFLLEKSIKQKKPSIKLSEQKAHLQRIEGMIVKSIRRKLFELKQKFESRNLKTVFLLKMNEMLRMKKQIVASLSTHIHTLNPQNTLKRGYAIVFEQGSTKVIRSSLNTKEGAPLDIAFYDGRVSALVIKNEKQ